MNDKIESAQYTCKGLLRLLNRLNMAAVDLDKGGGSIYELSGLLAAANNCADTLEAQLDSLSAEDDAQSGIRQPETQES
jgi:hypothetical protein